MSAVCIPRPGEVEIIDHPTRPLAHGEVRVRLEIGGICGSDVAAYVGRSPMVHYPRIIGHELVGTVIDRGKEPSLTIGQRVVVEPLLACGRCYACRQGRYNCCSSLRVLGVHEDGGLAHEFNVPRANVYEVPPGMSLETAVLAEPLCVALHALHRGRIDARERVVIFGAGPIGLLVLQAAVHHWGATAAVVDIRDDRLSIAQSLGATLMLNGGVQDVVSEITSWTEGEMAPLVIEATGHPQCTHDAVQVTAHAGRLVLLGWNSSTVEFDTVQAMRKELDVLGSRNSRDMFPEALEVLAAGKINVDRMITHRLPLAEAEKAFRLLDQPRSEALKVVLYPAPARRRVLNLGRS